MFITTRGHVEFMELSMSKTIGPDWKDLFALCLVNTRKSLFKRTNQAFYKYDVTYTSNKGKKILNIDQLRQY